MGIDISLKGVPQFDQFEIVKTGTLSLVKNATTASATTNITHGLGYIPVVVAFYISSTNTYSPIQYTEFSSTAVLALSINVSTTNNLLYLTATAPNVGTNAYYTDAYTFQIRYYLLRSIASI